MTDLQSNLACIIYHQIFVTMKLVIQTGSSAESPLQNEAAIAYLNKVHAVEASPPLEMGETKYHYLQIDESADVDWLITKLMDVPGIDAAYQKPDDQPAW
jgi:hypothetical protein